MTDKHAKWLTNTLLDIFEKHKQVVNLRPSLLGTKKNGAAIISKSKRFTGGLKFVLLALAKYSPCYLSLPKIGRICSLSKQNVILKLKILEQNKIITISKRESDYGDNQSNIYVINMPVLRSFFDVKACVQVRLSLVDNPKEVVTKHDHLVTEHDHGGHETGLGVVMKHDPIKQSGLINSTERADAPPDFSFAPDQENQFLCTELKLNLVQEVDRFVHRFKGKKTQFEFREWLKESYQYRRKNGWNTQQEPVRAGEIAEKTLERTYGQAPNVPYNPPPEPKYELPPGTPTIKEVKEALRQKQLLEGTKNGTDNGATGNNSG